MMNLKKMEKCTFVVPYLMYKSPFNIYFINDSLRYF